MRSLERDEAVGSKPGIKHLKDKERLCRSQNNNKKENISKQMTTRENLLCFMQCSFSKTHGCSPKSQMSMSFLGNITSCGLFWITYDSSDEKEQG